MEVKLWEGGLQSQEVKAIKLDNFAIPDRLNLVDSSRSLSDTISFSIPVAHTIFHKIESEKRHGWVSVGHRFDFPSAL